MRRHEHIFSVAMLLALTSFGCWQSTDETKQPPIEPLPEAKVEVAHVDRGELTDDGTLTLAVLGFEYEGPSVENSVLRDALAEMLTSDLSGYQDLQLVERRRVADLLNERELAVTGLTTATELTDAASTLEADLLLSGVLGCTSDALDLTVTVVAPGQETPVIRFSQSAPLQRLIDVQQQLVEHLAAVLRVERLPPATAELETSPTIAVLGFENLTTSTELESLRTGLSELLQAGLGVMEGVQLVEREQLGAVLEEQKLSLAELTSSESRLRVAQLLGAQRLVFGSVIRSGDRLRIESRLVDAAGGDVVAARAVSGPMDGFAELVERLTIQLVADLKLPTPASAANDVRRALPVQSLEALTQLQRADRALREFEYDLAARAYANVLLVEPANIRAHYGRVESLSRQGLSDELFDAIRQALGQEFAPHHAELRKTIFVTLSMAHLGRRDYPRSVEVMESMVREFSDTTTRRIARRQIAAARLLEGSLDEYLKSMEGELALGIHDDASREHVQLLQDLLEASDQFTNVNPLKQEPAFEERTLAVAQQSVELFDKLMDLAEGNESIDWETFGVRAIRYAESPSVYDHTARSMRPYLTPEQVASRMRRVGDVYAWSPRISMGLHGTLARKLAALGDLEGAADANRAVLEAAEGSPPEQIPAHFELYAGPNYESVPERVISARNHLSQIQVELGTDALSATGAVRSQYRDLGLANHVAGQTLAAFRRLGIEPAESERLALVWGGGSTTAQSWESILEPLGYRVHGARMASLTFGHLAPYDLVIVARQGLSTFTHDDLYALRSFVATGGSLLVNVSPGWFDASPAIHNSLLHFFDAQTGDPLGLWVSCDELSEDVVEAGIEDIRAKWACELLVGDAWRRLAASEDRVVLAGREYGKGRIVVTSFAQWFVPNPWDLVGKWSLGPHPNLRMRKTTEWPMEWSKSTHTDLLTHTVEWLSDTASDDEEDARMRAAIRTAAWKSLEMRYNVISHDELADAMSSLVDVAASGSWKEEALWIAATSSGTHIHAPRLNAENDIPVSRLWRPEVTVFNEGSRDRPVNRAQYRPPFAEYFERLVAQYPDSPMAPFAKLRLADCKRRLLLPISGERWPDHKHRIAAVAPEFESLELDEGSYAWAWRQIALAQIYFTDDDFDAASRAAEPVAERFPASPEKVLAIAVAAAGYEQSGEFQRAKVWGETLLTLPPMYWPSMNIGVSFEPHYVRVSSRDSHRHATNFLADVRRAERRGR